MLDFINLRGYEQAAVPHGAVTCQFTAPPVHEVAAQRTFVAPQCQLIGFERRIGGVETGIALDL